MVAFPPGWGRTPPGKRRPSKFKVTFTSARIDIQYEAKMMRATDLRIETDLPLRQDGMPRASGGEPDDPGVVIYWTRDDTRYAMACDTWLDVAGNLRAVALTLGAKRGVARWGATTDKAEYEGYRALPPPSRPEFGGTKYDVTPPHTILGVPERATRAQVKAAYRSLVQEAHPDRGGDTDRFRKLTEAYNALMQGAT